MTCCLAGFVEYLHTHASIREVWCLFLFPAAVNESDFAGATTKKGEV